MKKTKIDELKSKKINTVFATNMFFSIALENIVNAIKNGNLLYALDRTKYFKEKINDLSESHADLSELILQILDTAGDESMADRSARTLIIRKIIACLSSLNERLNQRALTLNMLNNPNLGTKHE